MLCVSTLALANSGTVCCARVGPAQTAAARSDAQAMLPQCYVLPTAAARAHSPAVSSSIGHVCSGHHPSTSGMHDWPQAPPPAPVRPHLTPRNVLLAPSVCTFPCTRTSSSLWSHSSCGSILLLTAVLHAAHDPSPLGSHTGGVSD